MTVARGLKSPKTGTLVVIFTPKRERKTNLLVYEYGLFLKISLSIFFFFRLFIKRLRSKFDADRLKSASTMPRVKRGKFFFKFGDLGAGKFRIGNNTGVCELRLQNIKFLEPVPGGLRFSNFSTHYSTIL